MFRTLLVLVACLVVAVGVALGEDPPASSVRTSELSALVDARIAQLEGLTLRGRGKKCLKGLYRAADLLGAPAPTRDLAVKSFKKTVGSLRSCLADEPEISASVGAVGDAYATELGADRDTAAARLGEIQEPRARRRTEKLLEAARRRLERAAAADEAKRRAALLAGASKSVSRAMELVEEHVGRLPDPSPTADAVVVVVEATIDGVRGPYAVTGSDDPAVETEVRPLFAGTSDPMHLGTVRVEGETHVTYVADGDFWMISLADPGAPPANLTGGLPPLDPAHAPSVSPTGAHAIVFPDAQQAGEGSAVLDLATGAAESIDTDGGAVTWASDGSRAVVSIVGEAPDFAGRLDLVEMDDELDWYAVTVAGPGADAESAYDPALSPGGRYVAYRCTAVAGGFSRLCVQDLDTRIVAEVSNSVVTLLSSQDFRTSRPVACTWTTDDQLLFDAVPDLYVATRDASAPGLSYDLASIDPTGSFYTVCGSTDRDAVLIDTQDQEIVHYAVGNGLSAVITTGPDPGCRLPGNDRLLLYSRNLPGESPEVRMRDLATGAEESVGSPETDPAEFATTFFRGLEYVPIGGGRGLVAYNVSGNVDATSGIYTATVEDQLTFRLRRAGRILLGRSADSVWGRFSAAVGTSADGNLRLAVSIEELSLQSGRSDLRVALCEVDLHDVTAPVQFVRFFGFDNGPTDAELHSILATDL